MDSNLNEANVQLFKEFMGDIVTDEMTEWLLEKGFFNAPAAAAHHSNFEGGLFYHSFLVADNLVNITEKMGLVWQNPRSPKVVGMFHDLCKMDEYTFTENGISHNSETLLKGHGVKSVMILSQMMKLTEEEVACITYHMGAYTDKSEWGNYGRAIRKYNNVLWTHTADMIASQIDEVKE